MGLLGAMAGAGTAISSLAGDAIKHINENEDRDANQLNAEKLKAIENQNQIEKEKRIEEALNRQRQGKLQDDKTARQDEFDFKHDPNNINADIKATGMLADANRKIKTDDTQADINLKSSSENLKKTSKVLSTEANAKVTDLEKEKFKDQQLSTKANIKRINADTEFMGEQIKAAQSAYEWNKNNPKLSPQAEATIKAIDSNLDTYKIRYTDTTKQLNDLSKLDARTDEQQTELLRLQDEKKEIESSVNYLISERYKQVGVTMPDSGNNQPQDKGEDNDPAKYRQNDKEKKENGMIPTAQAEKDKPIDLLSGDVDPEKVELSAVKAELKKLGVGFDENKSIYALTDLLNFSAKRKKDYEQKALDDEKQKAKDKQQAIRNAAGGGLFGL